MSCHRYRKALVLYLHGELADDERYRFEQHLETCSACRQELEAFQAVIERATRKTAPVPADHVVNEIRHAARVAVIDAGQQAPGTVWRYRWYGLRPGVIAAACLTVLTAVVILVVAVTGRGRTRPVPEPPVIVAEPVAPSWVDQEELMKSLLPSDQPDIFMTEMRAPAGLEARLADLEANTFYIHEQMALETAPLFDRQVRSVEHAVVRLAVELE